MINDKTQGREDKKRDLPWIFLVSFQREDSEGPHVL